MLSDFYICSVFTYLTENILISLSSDTNWSVSKTVYNYRG